MTSTIATSANCSMRRFMTFSANSHKSRNARSSVLPDVYQRQHLLEGAAIGKVGVGIEHHRLITGEVTAFVHLLYEKPQAAAQRLVHNGFHRLLIGIRTEYLIVRCV